MSNIWFQCQNKRLSAKCLHINPSESNVRAEAALVCENCKHAGSNHNGCQFCFGLCIEVQKEVYNPDIEDFYLDISYLRDKTIKNEAGDILEVRDASNYLEKNKHNIIWEQKERNWNPANSKTTLGFEAAVPSKSSKTACLRCKIKIVKACQKCKEKAEKKKIKLDCGTCTKGKMLCQQGLTCNYGKQKIVMVWTCNLGKCPTDPLEDSFINRRSDLSYLRK